jgi:hypothetical protein
MVESMVVTNDSEGYDLGYVFHSLHSSGLAAIFVTA